MKKGFTLAETLIALAVIGIVAAIMMPALNYLIQTKVREHQVEVSKLKFNKASEMMTLNGKMGPYYVDTADFVDELQKHLKLVRVCRVGNSPNDLPPVSDCFGENYDEIILNESGDTYKISDIKTGAELGLDTVDDNNDWTSNNIAIMTIDGIRMILSYNSKCPPVDPGVHVGNTSLACVAGVADVDGEKKPNTLYKDIYLFGSAKKIGDSCIGKALGLCLPAPITVADIVSAYGKVNTTECLNASWGNNQICDTYSYNMNGSNYKDNIWYASVIKYCGGQDKILSFSDARKIVDYICGDNGCSNSPSVEEKNAVTLRAQSFGINSPYSSSLYPYKWRTIVSNQVGVYNHLQSGYPCPGVYAAQMPYNDTSLYFNSDLALGPLINSGNFYNSNFLGTYATGNDSSLNEYYVFCTK